MIHQFLHDSVTGVSVEDEGIERDVLEEILIEQQTSKQHGKMLPTKPKWIHWNQAIPLTTK